ncbi:MAG: thioredoxin domain-containing protein [Bacteroidales bacterium]
MKTNIKKYILALMLGSFAVTGCGNSSAESANSTSDQGASVSENKAAENKASANEKKSGNDSVKGTIMLTKADFLEKVMDYESNPEEWVYKGDRPAMIDFYADWCGPCRTAAPILEELAKEYADEIYIYKIDTEVERELAAVFGISSLPSFLFVPQKGRPTMSNGIARTPEETKEMFSQMIDEILLGKGNPEAL